jgi:hypothetical protein
MGTSTEAIKYSDLKESFIIGSKKSVRGSIDEIAIY